MSKFLFFLDA